jgi:catechol 2,3-dioxygenase-like lactoylglutathione lyase family enzyme
MERSLQFYVDGLGFELVQQWTHEGTIRWCRLLRAGGSLMLQDSLQDDGSRWSPPGAVGVGISIVFICNDALAIYQEARARGLEASKPFVGNGMWVTTLRDPDGYRLEFESKTDTAEETEFAG